MLNSATNTVVRQQPIARRGHETPATQPREIFGVQAFRRVLDHERARTDRSGLPFAVVTFEAREAASAATDLRIAAEMLTTRLRAIDEMGWMKQGRLAAVLPYSGSDAAWKLADDLLNAYPLNGIPPACEVYAYPSNWPAPSDEPTIDDDEGSARRPVRQLEPLFARPLPLWKRLIDIVGSTVGLFLLAPLLLFVALGIKVTSAGPIFFLQRRTGLGGRRFLMVKFRSMACNAEQQRALYLDQNEQDGPAFKITNDPRVTPLGRWLRISSIDELPQLWNVLKGEMSLVGPRPLPCPESEACEPWQRRRNDVTPGITGLWQAQGRSRESFANWMRLDLRYIRECSFWNDIKLIALTIPTVLKNRSDR